MMTTDSELIGRLRELVRNGVMNHPDPVTLAAEAADRLAQLTTERDNAKADAWGEGYAAGQYDLASEPRRLQMPVRINPHKPGAKVTYRQRQENN
jgi:hypothetical protein